MADVERAIDTAEQEKEGEVARSNRLGGGRDHIAACQRRLQWSGANLPDSSDNDRQGKVIASLGLAVGRERHAERDNGRKEVRRRREQKSGCQCCPASYGTHVLVLDMPNVLTTVGMNEVTAAAVVLVTWIKASSHSL